MVITSHRGILKPVQQLKGLGKLYVFLHKLCQMEEMAEKDVMGREYDNGKEGKAPPDARTYVSPHERWSDWAPAEAAGFIDGGDSGEDGGDFGGDW